MFDVFVEGAVDGAPDAVRRLADTMAVKFGLSADDFVARLVRGRVRVKAKVDRQTADAYVRELVKIGARCVVEESRPTAATPPAGVRLATPPGGLRAVTPPAGVRTPPSRADLLRTTPAAGVAQTSRTTPPVGSAVQRPPTSPRAASVSSGPSEARAHTISAGIPTRPPAPLVAATFRTPAGGTPTKPPASTSGLSAATSGLSAATMDPGTPTNLGALDTSSPLALSSLDGNDAMSDADSSGSFGPPLELDNGPSGEPGKLIAPKAAPGTTKPPVSKDRPKDEPLDLFAPPDAGEEHVAVELAADEVEYKARKQTPLPMPVAVPPRDATPIPQRSSSPAIAQATQAPARSKLGPLADLKIRFAAGVVAAILVGFLPATLIASIRERSAFKAIDDSYVQTTLDPANQTADVDASFLDKKKSARRDIALTSMLIWAIGGGAIAYVWFRRVPWDRWA
jgi:hypothetical protein